MARIAGVGVVMAVLAAMPGAAAADEARARFAFGAGFGRGAIDVSCDACGDVAPLTEGLTLTAHAGVMLSPRLAVGADVWSVVWAGRDASWFGDSRDHVVRETFYTAAAQVWVARKLWLKAGLGVAEADFGDSMPNGDPRVVFAKRPPEESTSQMSPATVFAVGYEVVSTPTFALDVQWRAGAGHHGDEGFDVVNTGVSAGFSWF